jgi:hypothetical protein
MGASGIKIVKAERFKMWRSRVEGVHVVEMLKAEMLEAEMPTVGTLAVEMP